MGILQHGDQSTTTARADVADVTSVISNIVTDIALSNDVQINLKAKVTKSLKCLQPTSAWNSRFAVVARSEWFILCPVIPAHSL